MNYRSRQVRSMWGKDIATKTQAWEQERRNLQQDILNLQNSTDAKIIEQLEKDLHQQKDLLNQTIELLGKADIKTLSDLSNLLQGKSLKELKTNLEQKIKEAQKEIDHLEKKVIQQNQNYWKLEEQNTLIQKAHQETKQTLTKTEKDLAQAHQSRKNKIGSSRHCQSVPETGTDVWHDEVFRWAVYVGFDVDGTHSSLEHFLFGKIKDTGKKGFTNSICSSCFNR